MNDAAPACEHNDLYRSVWQPPSDASNAAKPFALASQESTLRCCAAAYCGNCLQLCGNCLQLSSKDVLRVSSSS